LGTLVGTCSRAARAGFRRLSYADGVRDLDNAVSRIADWSSRVAPIPTIR